MIGEKNVARLRRLMWLAYARDVLAACAARNVARFARNMACLAAAEMEPYASRAPASHIASETSHIASVSEPH